MGNIKAVNIKDTLDDFKKRYGRSPDKADALLLAYYKDYRHGTGVTTVQLRM